MVKCKCLPKEQWTNVSMMSKLLFLLFWFVSLSAYGQSDKQISVSFVNEDAVSALKKVEQLSGQKIQYNYEDVNFKVTYKAERATATEIITAIIKNHNLKLQRKGKYLVITPDTKKQLKGIVIKGKIVDERGDALIGASVQMKGSGKGVITDIDGNYTFIPSVDEGIVTISYIGYTTQEIPLERFADMRRVSMKPDQDNVLEDVVVTGMTKMDRRLFTGATDKINAEESLINGMADISRSLEGRAAGVSVQNVSGTFGTAPKIRVRGATSIYGSSKPLWVVDGVIMEDVTDISADDLSSGDTETLISSAIAGLNSDDIESFQILKDGSATSIYGARAMAGVIVVTTKRGKMGTSRISYTGEYTMRLIPHYGEFNIMNSQEQMGIYKEMQQKGWLNFSDTYRASESGVYGKMFQLMNTFNETTGMFMIENTTNAENRYLYQAEHRNTDWFDELFSTNIMHNHSVSISGGTERFNTYASISAMVDPGWYKASEVNRYTANLNTNYNIFNSLSLNIITSGSYRKQKAPGTLSQTIDPVFGEVKRDFDINPYSYALNTSRTLDPTVFYTRNYADFNILHELDNNYINLSVVDVKFQAELKYKPIRDMEISALGAIKYSTTSQQHQITEYSNQALAYRAMPDATVRDRNPYLYTDPDNPYALPISVLPKGGMYQKKEYNMKSYDFRATANYSHEFNRTHIVNLFGGLELNDIQRGNDYFNGWGMEYDKGEIPFYVYEWLKKSIEAGTDYYSLTNTNVRSSAFFGNATYSYKGRYVINGTYRYEGTNRLGKNRSARWLPTWNISGSWNVSEEAFFAKLRPALSHLALKASYSLTGDPGPASVTNSSMILRNYKPYRPFTTIQESGLDVEDLPNEELTYEKKHELNIGVETGFLNNRINLAADWYKRNNYDLIGVAYTPGVGGQIRKLANVASMRSHGVEFTLSTKNIQGKDFSWNTDFIFSYAKNKVTELESNAKVIDVVTGYGFALKDYPVRSLFSYDFRGLTDEGKPIILEEDGKETSNGDDINFQSQDLDNLVYEGPADPTITGSFGNILRYKGFTLNVFITYSFGNVIRLDPVFKSRYSDLTAMPKEFKNRWVEPGDELITHVPAILTARQVNADYQLATLYNAYNYSTQRIAKGDFIRLKEVSLGYQFPKTWVERIRLSDLSLKLQATNLFLIYADKKLNGQDPEFFRTGGVAAPVPKQFTLTLKLGI